MLQGKQMSLFTPEEAAALENPLVAAAQDTLEQMHHLDSAYAQAVSYHDIFLQSDWVNREFGGVVQVLDSDTMDAAQRYEKDRPCILNFASATNPGGGWLAGASAQEESIARRSSLVLSLIGDAMYEKNRDDPTPLYHDDMIYSPRVLTLKTAELAPIPDGERFEFAAVTAAAVNKHYASDTPQDMIDACMLNRVRKVLDIMHVNGHKTIILGAWGCGAFGQDVHRVAEYFYRVLFEEGAAPCFTNIVFAIYRDPEKLDVFRQVFAKELAPES